MMKIQIKFFFFFLGGGGEGGGTGGMKRGQGRGTVQGERWVENLEQYFSSVTHCITLIAIDL